MGQIFDYNYNQVVVVAETQLKISAYKQTSCSPYNHSAYVSSYPANGSKFSMYFAGYEWECTFDYPYSIKLEFKGFQNNFNQLHVEMVLCDEKFHPFSGFPKRQMLTTGAATWRYNFSFDPQPYDTNPNRNKNHENVYLVLRVLGDRSPFPNFTSPDVKIGHMESNGKLRVGQSVFHVNKELLSFFSPYFNALFNNPNFDEAKQNVVELKGETETKDPALFHDFLLAISVENFLPNVKNVAGLLALAQCYQVDRVHTNCANHLKFAREMPVRERFALAQKYGLKDLVSQIIKEQQTLEDKDALVFAALKF